MTSIETSDWFEENKSGNNPLWGISPSAIKTALDMVLEARLKQPHKTNLVVVPRLMTYIWRIQMVKEGELLFTISVGMNFGGYE